MEKNVCERVMNLFTCKNLEDKTISIDLNDVNYWVEDKDPNVVELYLKHTNYAIWIKVNEKTFRKYYLDYKAKNG